MSSVLNIAILASGSGSNAEAIIKRSRGTNVNPVVVITDKSNAKVIERANRLGVTAGIVKQYGPGNQNRIRHETRLIDIFRALKIDLVVLAGYMRIITPKLINEFHGKWMDNIPGIMNIHPADTLEYQGLHGYEFALGLVPGSQRLSETKITVHFVDEGMDTGPIIEQRALKVESNDTLETLKPRGLKLEHHMYFDCIQRYANKEKQLCQKVPLNLT